MGRRWEERDERLRRLHATKDQAKHRRIKLTKAKAKEAERSRSATASLQKQEILGLVRRLLNKPAVLSYARRKSYPSAFDVFRAHLDDAVEYVERLEEARRLT